LISSPAHSLPPERRNMSMIFQSYALWPHMTVAENIVYGLKLRKLGRDIIAKKLDAILATTKLAPLAERYPGELSGGQQQRVALARALIVEPETLLLDEPLSNLDANLREEMRFEVRRLHDAYRYTTIYVTHDQSEAMTTADLICVMNHGKIEQSGSPEDVYDRPRSEFVARFIGSSNVVKGKARDEARIGLAGAALRCVGAKLKAGVDAAVSIRPHDIRISATQPQQAENIVPATVTRQVFLGGSRDYMVELKDGTQLRVVTASGESIAQGSAVWLVLPPEKCRALLG
jgi:iron(III) transport system ATP-binding protein